jgi:hypothetical protein
VSRIAGGREGSAGSVGRFLVVGRLRWNLLQRIILRRILACAFGFPPQLVFLLLLLCEVALTIRKRKNGFVHVTSLLLVSN